MSLEEATRRTVEGLAGKLMLGIATTLIAAGVGYIIRTSIDHTAALAGIARDQAAVVSSITDLKQIMSAHNDVVDKSLDKLNNDEQAHAIAIARAQTELAALEAVRDRPPIREYVPALPPVNPNIFDALSHAFSPKRHRH